MLFKWAYLSTGLTGELSISSHLEASSIQCCTIRTLSYLTPSQNIWFHAGLSNWWPSGAVNMRPMQLPLLLPVALPMWCVGHPDGGCLSGICWCQSWTALIWWLAQGIGKGDTPFLFPRTSKSQDLLANLLLALAKLSLYQTREEVLARGDLGQLQGCLPCPCLLTFPSRVSLGGIQWLFRWLQGVVGSGWSSLCGVLTGRPGY